MDQAALQGSRPRAEVPHTGHEGKDQAVDTTLIPAANPATHRQIGAADAKRSRVQMIFQTVTASGNSHCGPAYPGGKPARNFQTRFRPLMGRSKQSLDRHQPAQGQPDQCGDKPQHYGDGTRGFRSGQIKYCFQGAKGQSQASGGNRQSPDASAHPASTFYRPACRPSPARAPVKPGPYRRR